MWWRQLLAQGRTDTLFWVGSTEAPLARTDQSLAGPLLFGKSENVGRKKGQGSLFNEKIHLRYKVLLVAIIIENTHRSLIRHTPPGWVTD